jgi:hypothetical protein
MFIVALWNAYCARRAIRNNDWGLAVLFTILSVIFIALGMAVWEHNQ